MGSPVSDLKPERGRLFATLFENPRANVPRSVYWGVHIECAPFDYAGEECAPSLACEWIPWSARSWRELDGKTLSFSGDEEGGPEATLYVVAHDPAESVDLAIRHVDTARFHVDMRMTVDFSGVTGEDAADGLTVAVAAVVPFEGVWLQPESFLPAPRDREAMLALARPFLDLDAFDLRDAENGAFLFAPTACSHPQPVRTHRGR